MPAVGCHVRVVFHQVGFVLVGLTAQKSKKVIKTLTTWLTVKGTGIRCIFIRCQAILAYGKCVIAVAPQYLRNGPRRRRDAAVITRETGRQGDMRETSLVHKVAVTSRHQGPTSLDPASLTL